MKDAVNALDNVTVDEKSFSWLNLLGIDRWEPFTVVFGSLTIVGAPSYTGRYRKVGKKLEFQVKFSAATSIASVAGTDHLNLPVAAKGLAGIATMTNFTTKVAVGVCHIDVTATTWRCYLPAQAASGNVFNLFGQYEIG